MAQAKGKSYIKHHVNGTNTFFRPSFPEKYKGQWPIILRSEWERMFAQWCDVNPNVLSWSSETLTIPYFDPVRKRMRRYYPDFMLKALDKNKKEKVYVVEIKPLKQTLPPKKGNKTEKTKIYEQMTYIVNNAKWKAAEEFCKRQGFIFRIFTEKELFKK
jgi:hypothetical protein